MISFQEALQSILSTPLPLVGDEKINFTNSLDRILSTDIYAQENIPLAPLSSMDGYAFNYEDLEILKTQGLEILQDNPAGSELSICKKGCAIKTFTGALMPKMTDTIVLIEECQVQNQRIFLHQDMHLQKGAWVRPVGSNYQSGEKLLQQGLKISPYEIGLLAELNCNFISVKQKPKVGILVSGSEIIEVGEKREHNGQVRSVNNHLIKAMVEKSGGQAIVYETLQDDKDTLLKTFTKMLNECDLIVTTGGMSKGDYDFTQDVILEHSDVIFKGVRIKPGKPVLFALSKASKKPILGLAGNPNAAAITFYLFGSLLLKRMTKQKAELKVLKAYLKEEMTKKDQRLEFRSVKLEVLEGKYYVSNLCKNNQSAIINNLCEDRALVIFDAEKTILAKDTEVDIILLKEFE
ncbi:molybdopterin molybdotransferase MoeA [Helicobacter sp. faydin-H20]|uniref:molybdopterin molybdotransferase MoeA n=1 Tax=Helicobacter anatolicus TaxID=2905874 RepID=UPI001E58D1CD|nr:molybdopterin molybdotransferase MoeA [Helicobacter anatolicus]MCE3037619.1 molybdopterin molybdotransferase MoeA [Helicobacter anatolicus]